MLEIDLLIVSESNPRLSNLDVYICAVPRVTKTGTVDKSCFGLNFCLKGKPKTSQQKKKKKKRKILSLLLASLLHSMTFSFSHNLRLKPLKFQNIFSIHF